MQKSSEMLVYGKFVDKTKNTLNYCLTKTIFEINTLKLIRVAKVI